MDLQLHGRRALVTGASRGIGRAVAETLAAEGCALGLCARGAGDLDALAGGLRSAGTKVHTEVLDVADDAAVRGWVVRSAEALGGIDILVANASGFADGAGPDAMRHAFQSDLLHTVHALETALPHLRQSAAGAVVAVSSISGIESWGTDEIAYGTMKAALLFYTKGMARELAPAGIRVNAVSPGTTYVTGGVWHKVQHDDPDGFRKALAENPLGRMGTAQEVANAVVFLASPVASFITGANLVVDGTYTRRVPM